MVVGFGGGGDDIRKGFQDFNLLETQYPMIEFQEYVYGVPKDWKGVSGNEFERLLLLKIF